MNETNHQAHDHHDGHGNSNNRNHNNTNNDTDNVNNQNVSNQRNNIPRRRGGGGRGRGNRSTGRNNNTNNNNTNNPMSINDNNNTNTASRNPTDISGTLNHHDRNTTELQGNSITRINTNNNSNNNRRRNNNINRNSNNNSNVTNANTTTATTNNNSTNRSNSTNNNNRNRRNHNTRSNYRGRRENLVTTTSTNAATTLNNEVVHDHENTTSDISLLVTNSNDVVVTINETNIVTTVNELVMNTTVTKDLVVEDITILKTNQTVLATSDCPITAATDNTLESTTDQRKDSTDVPHVPITRLLTTINTVSPSTNSDRVGDSTDVPHEPTTRILTTVNTVTPTKLDIVASNKDEEDLVKLDESVRHVICESPSIATSATITREEELDHNVPALFSNQMTHDSDAKATITVSAASTTTVEGIASLIDHHGTTEMKETDHQQKQQDNEVEAIDTENKRKDDDLIRLHNHQKQQYQLRIDHHDVYQQHMKRCNEILECNNQLVYYKRQLHILKQEHTKQQLMATLTISKNNRNISVWNALSKKEKYKRTYILLMLQCANISITNSASTADKMKLFASCSKPSSTSSTTIYQLQQQVQENNDSRKQKTNKKNDYHLPNALLESSFEKMVPNKLKMDRDIFLARISTWSFRNYYNTHHQFHYSSLNNTNENNNDNNNNNNISNNKNNNTNSSNHGNTRKGQHQQPQQPTTANQNHRGIKVVSDNLLLPSTISIPERFWDDDVVMKSVVYYFPELLLWIKNSSSSNSSNDQTNVESNDPSDKKLPYEIYDSLDVDNNDNNNTNLRTPKKRKNNQESRKKNLVSSSSASSLSNMPATPSSSFGVFPERYWSDIDIFLQFIQSPNISNYVLETLPDIIEKFDMNIIRNNSQLMLYAIARSSKCFAKVHESLRNDKTFILQALDVMKDQLSNHFLSECSSDTQADIDVVMAVVQRNGMNLQYAHLGFRRHHRVIRAASINNPRALVYSDKKCRVVTRLRKDKSFWIKTVFNAITKEASNESCKMLVSKPSILFSATMFLPTQTRDPPGFMTFTSRKFAMKTDIEDFDEVGTLKVLDEDLMLKQLWNLLDESLKQDIDIILAAVKSGCLSISAVKKKITAGNSDFWIKLLNYDSRYYWDIPTSLLVSDPSIVLKGITKIKDEVIVRGIFSRLPQLETNRLFWLTIVRSIPVPTTAISRFEEEPDATHAFSMMNEDPVMTDNSSVSSDLSVSALCELFALAPPSIMSDKDIMVEACLRDYSVYEMLNGPLTEDYDILKAMITCSPEALHMINPWQQHRYPELVRIAILSLKEGDMWDIFECIDDGLWATDRSIALAWLSKGGDYLHDEFPSAYENDAEMFLHIAKHNPHDFWCASETLCSNKEFMLQVVAINGQLLCEAWSHLSKDYDLAIVAFSSTPDLCSRYDVNDNDDFMFLVSFAKYVRERIQEHDNFIQMLCGISLSSSSRSIRSKVGSRTVSKEKQCYLQLLDQGNETSLAYKKLLAEFIGPPSGNLLKQLRQASINLSTWGY